MSAMETFFDDNNVVSLVSASSDGLMTSIEKYAKEGYVYKSGTYFRQPFSSIVKVELHKGIEIPEEVQHREFTNDRGMRTFECFTADEFFLQACKVFSEGSRYAPFSALLSVGIYQVSVLNEIVEEIVEETTEAGAVVYDEAHLDSLTTKEEVHAYAEALGLTIDARLGVDKAKQAVKDEMAKLQD